MKEEKFVENSLLLVEKRDFHGKHDGSFLWTFNGYTAIQLVNYASSKDNYQYIGRDIFTGNEQVFLYRDVEGIIDGRQIEDITKVTSYFIEVIDPEFSEFMSKRRSLSEVKKVIDRKNKCEKIKTSGKQKIKSLFKKIF